MGSKSDLSVGQKCTAILDRFGIEYELRVASAHRAPKYLEGIIEAAEEAGCTVFVGIAGVAAALPGVIASMTSKPVIGVPVGGKVPLDSLLSIVQMPPGIPVATVAINGALNAGILAAQMMGTNDNAIFSKTVSYKNDLKNKIVKANQELEKEKFKFRVS